MTVKLKAAGDERPACVGSSELDTFICREDEKERRARASIRRSPQTPAVSFHYGAAEPQPDPHALRFS
jgi:hypothetical protein